MDSDKIEDLADWLYARGYDDRMKEKDYDPRGCEQWQAVVDALAVQQPAAVVGHSTYVVYGDDAAVDLFAEAMKAKMAASRAKGRSGWHDPDECPADHLRAMLIDHVAKGDPVDVGNLAMMLYNRDESTAPVPTAGVQGDGDLQTALTVFDMGLGFALCHKDFGDTRGAVKKLQKDFEAIRSTINQQAATMQPDSGRDAALEKLERHLLQARNPAADRWKEIDAALNIVLSLRASHPAPSSIEAQESAISAAMAEGNCHGVKSTVAARIIAAYTAAHPANGAQAEDAIITDPDAEGYRPPCCNHGSDKVTCCSGGCAADEELAELAATTNKKGTP